MTNHRALLSITAVILAGILTGAQLQAQTPASELAGLWKAKRRFGPDARGVLNIQRNGNAYTADMLGFAMPVLTSDGELTFELPNREASFRGKLQPNGSIRGFWLPPKGSF